MMTLEMLELFVGSAEQRHLLPEPMGSMACMLCILRLPPWPQFAAGQHFLCCALAREST